MSKKLVVEIDENGNTKLEAFGFPDGTCLKETKAIEDALGKVTNREKKPEALVVTAKAGGVKVGS